LFFVSGVGEGSAAKYQKVAGKFRGRGAEMIPVLVAIVGTLVASIFAFVLGAGMGHGFLESNLLKEGFYIDRNLLVDLGHGRIELYRRNADGKWVRIKNVE
jgi:hypothetical protein